MNSQTKPTPLIIRITNYLPLAEKVFLIALAIGIVLRLSNIDSLVMIISLAGLAVTFFLSAYRIIDIPRKENETFGFQELLGYLIVPKILYISCAVATCGILFYFLNLGNEGYRQMLFIGGTSLGLGIVIIAYLAVTGVKYMGAILPVLYRAIPLLVLDLYLFFK